MYVPATQSNQTLQLLVSKLKLGNVLELFCVGGASLFVMAICAILTNPSILLRDDVRIALAQLSATGLFFPALLSYSHSMWSFRFAYWQGGAFVFRHNFALLIFPIAIISLLITSAMTWLVPVSTLPLLANIEQQFNTIGIAINWTKYNSLGQLLISLLLILQITMSGYHYGMQALGVALACGEKHGYRLDDKQKAFLRYNIYSIWILNLLSGYTFLSILDSKFYGYRPVQFPKEWQAIAALVFVVSLVLLLPKVIIPIYKQTKQLPPAPTIMTMVALWLWLQPFFQPYGFQATIVPFAHGLQYLYFAAKGEANGFARKQVTSSSNSKAWLLTLSVFVILVPCGYFAYKYLPVALDRTTLIHSLAPNFFILCAYIFFNTQHYAIDSVIWRRDSKLYSLFK
ncbi:MAG: hypothetical protein IPO31_12985 [Candidatus Obscuribacter sp.]|nr:hypothetical protein [Candidatus Obscuribacter sp.]